MTEDICSTPSTPCKGLSITAMILGIVSIVIEGCYIVFLLVPAMAKLSVFVNAPVVIPILFWGGIVFSIISDILITVSRKHNPEGADKKRITVAEVLSGIFILMLIAGIIICFVCGKSIFSI